MSWEESSFDCCHFWLWRGFWEKRWLLLHLPAMITFHLPSSKANPQILNPIPSNIWLQMVSDCHLISPPVNSFWNLLMSSDWDFIFLIPDRSVSHLLLSLSSFVQAFLWHQTTLRVLLLNQFKPHKLLYYVQKCPHPKYDGEDHPDNQFAIAPFLFPPFYIGSAEMYIPYVPILA